MERAAETPDRPVCWIRFGGNRRVAREAIVGVTGCGGGRCLHWRQEQLVAQTCRLQSRLGDSADGLAELLDTLPLADFVGLLKPEPTSATVDMMLLFY